MPTLGLRMDEQVFGFFFFFSASWVYNWLSVNCTHLKCTIGYIWAYVYSHGTTLTIVDISITPKSFLVVYEAGWEL